MRVVNRIVVILLLAALFVLGVCAVVYAFDLFGYSLADALNPLNALGSGVQNYIAGVEGGNLPALDIVILVLLALLGLFLLIAELKPPTPRRVRMDAGTYITRDAVRAEVEAGARHTLGVLESSARVKARRKPGAKVELKASVRRGEDTSALQTELRRSLRERLAKRGIPVNNLKVKLAEVDPRQAETRVR